MSKRAARLRVLLLTCACGLLGGAACGSGASEYGDAPLASGAQIRWEFRAEPPYTETLLVVVDDTPTGAGLRDALAEAFDDWDAELARHREGCDGPADPAVWHPIDRSLVIVHPSTPGTLGVWSPAQDPALRLQALQTFGAERTRWVDAVRAGISAQPAAPGAPFQALAALTNVESLLDGSRPPETAAERDVLDALPSPLNFGKVIALATEDASPGEAGQYPPKSEHESLGVVLPAAQPHELAECSVRDVPTTPRYQALSDSSQAWPCENPRFFGSILWTDCAPRCLPQPIAIDAGIAQCRVMANAAGREPCPTELGWLDPLDGNGQRTPRIEGNGPNAMRVCEIRQLEGAALASCVTRLDCADCEPGWCATEVPELLPQNACAAGSSYPPFRFVLGAAQARSALVTVVCNEAAR
ncbi:MAG: hypothetical protein WDO74_25505 [Pseudomonadota bacterium]